MPEKDEMNRFWQLLNKQQEISAQQGSLLAALAERLTARQLDEETHKHEEREFRSKLDTTLRRLFDAQTAIRDQQAKIINQSKGGWRVLLALGSVLTGLLTVGAWLYLNVVPHPVIPPVLPSVLPSVLPPPR